MNPSRLLLVLPLLCPLCVAAEEPTVPVRATEGAPALPRIQPWGFDLAGRDLSVSPGQDFNLHASGSYYRNTPIPDDKIAIGGFMTLIEQAEKQVLAIVEEEAALTRPEGDDALVGTLYRSFMDESRIEALDDSPLRAGIERIRAASTRELQARLMGDAHGGMGGSFFVNEVMGDMKEPSRNALYVAAAGLGMPDRDFYLAEPFEPVRSAYRSYLEALLTSIRWPAARQAAAEVWELELRIARVHWTRTERRQRERTYNPMTIAELEAYALGFPGGNGPRAQGWPGSRAWS
ncbi:MAG: hypothetical protein IPK20_17500 [Betaproteobacteria bacterium]|nr:hypothetical protein [Betaproteobacteria bacterium]